jgi:hypothetical protein
LPDLSEHGDVSDWTNGDGPWLNERSDKRPLTAAGRAADAGDDPRAADHPELPVRAKWRALRLASAPLRPRRQPGPRVAAVGVRR